MVHRTRTREQRTWLASECAEVLSWFLKSRSSLTQTASNQWWGLFRNPFNSSLISKSALKKCRAHPAQHEYTAHFHLDVSKFKNVCARPKALQSMTLVYLITHRQRAHPCALPSSPFTTVSLPPSTLHLAPETLSNSSMSNSPCLSTTHPPPPCAQIPGTKGHLTHGNSNERHALPTQQPLPPLAPQPKRSMHNDQNLP